jgi:hypothetical protein
VPTRSYSCATRGVDGVICTDVPALGAPFPVTGEVFRGSNAIVRALNAIAVVTGAWILATKGMCHA